MPRDGTKNLLPQSGRSKEERKEIARLGGVASGIARRQRKAMSETLDTLLSLPLKDDKLANIEKIKSVAALNGKNITVQEAVLLAQIQKAIKGDTRAFMAIKDLCGENTAEKEKMLAKVAEILCGVQSAF